jgi:hypothetical protein
MKLTNYKIWVSRGILEEETGCWCECSPRGMWFTWEEEFWRDGTVDLFLPPSDICPVPTPSRSVGDRLQQESEWLDMEFKSEIPDYLCIAEQLIGSGLLKVNGIVGNCKRCGATLQFVNQRYCGAECSQLAEMGK